MKAAEVEYLCTNFQKNSKHLEIKFELTCAPDEDFKKYRIHTTVVHVQSKLNPRMCATHIAFNKKELFCSIQHTQTALPSPRDNYEGASLHIW